MIIQVPGNLLVKLQPHMGRIYLKMNYSCMFIISLIFGCVTKRKLKRLCIHKSISFSRSSVSTEYLSSGSGFIIASGHRVLMQTL